MVRVPERTNSVDKLVCCMTWCCAQGFQQARKDRFFKDPFFKDLFFKDPFIKDPFSVPYHEDISLYTIGNLSAKGVAGTARTERTYPLR